MFTRMKPVTFPTAPKAPKIARARPCSFGSGKCCIIIANAEGNVIAAPAIKDWEKNVKLPELRTDPLHATKNEKHDGMHTDST